MSLEGMLHSDQEIRGRISGMSVIHTDAYEIALRNGFEGTVEEWLASLKGEKGDPGEAYVGDIYVKPEVYDIIKNLDKASTEELSENAMVLVEDDGLVARVPVSDIRAGGENSGGADWNAAEGEPGHIKNRTHWDDCEEVAFVEDKTVNKTGYTTVSWLTYEKVKDCTTARVIFNGVEYVCPVTVKINFTEYGDESYFYIGNFQDGAPQYPFCFWGYILNNFAIVNAEDGTHTVSIYGRKEVVHKLPEKYLPDYIKTVNGISPDENGNVEVTVSGGNVDQVSIEPAEDDIPKVFFGGALQQTKDEKVVPFRYISKTEDISGYAEIKAQGNSSMNYAKKNQTVKMFKDSTCEEKLKVAFKGWGKQNKHCYKANWIDLSHARNVVSARLWGDVVKSRTNYAELPELFRTTPNQGAVDGFPVKVYAGGIYQGRYTLNIPKDKWTFNMDDELDTHCVLCGENYASGCFRAAAKIDESDWTDEIHDTVPASIKTRWNEVISFVMNSTDDEFRANLGNYFYVDSLIDYYLFGLASCGLDAFGKNQIYATYDGQRWIASMYDMDSTWGLYWNGSKFVATDYARTSYEDMVSGRQGNLLYIRLEQLFWAELQTRWEELKNGALSIENIINRFERFTDIAPTELVKEDYATTTGGGKFTGIPSKDTNNIQQIRSFALERQVWTDAYLDGITPVIPVPCTGITLDKGALTFNGTGTRTITATVTPDGCTDTMIWVSANPEIANINVDGDVCTVESVTNGSTTITVRCGNYSASCSVSVSGIPVPVPCTGITLDKNELMFNAEGTQIITATVTPTDTTDSVVWTSSNETVATVENGVVTAVASGTATITATCGGYSATCTVSVSIIVAPVYELAEATTFDGTNYIDTGVSPLAKQQDFTLLLEWEHTGESVWAGNSHVVMHCMHEVSPHPGMQLAYHANGFQMEARQKNAVMAFSVTKDGIATSDINTIRIAYKIDWSNRLITVSRRYNGSGEIYSNNATPTFVQIDENVLLGCYQTADGTTERYAKGIMRNCKIYTCALPDAEIEAWLNS